MCIGVINRSLHLALPSALRPPSAHPPTRPPLPLPGRGVHWNQAASNALRTTIYDVVVEQSFLGGAQADLDHRPASPTANGSTTSVHPAAAVVAADATPGARRRSSRLGGAAAESGAPGAAAGGTTVGSGKSAAVAAAAAATAARRALQRRRVWGMAACFVASGVAHEIIFV